MDGGESHAPKRSIVMVIKKTTSYIKVINIHLESVYITHCINNNIIDCFRLLIKYGKYIYQHNIHFKMTRSVELAAFHPPTLSKPSECASTLAETKHEPKLLNS